MIAGAERGQFGFLLAVDDPDGDAGLGFHRRHEGRAVGRLAHSTGGNRHDIPTAQPRGDLVHAQQGFAGPLQEAGEMIPDAVSPSPSRTVAFSSSRTRKPPLPPASTTMQRIELVPMSMAANGIFSCESRYWVFCPDRLECYGDVTHVAGKPSYREEAAMGKCLKGESEAKKKDAKFECGKCGARTRRNRTSASRKDQGEKKK